MRGAEHRTGDGPRPRERGTVTKTNDPFPGEFDVPGFPALFGVSTWPTAGARTSASMRRFSEYSGVTVSGASAGAPRHVSGAVEPAVTTDSVKLLVPGFITEHAMEIWVPPSRRPLRPATSPRLPAKLENLGYESSSFPNIRSYPSTSPTPGSVARTLRPLESASRGRGGYPAGQARHRYLLLPGREPIITAKAIATLDVGFSAVELVSGVGGGLWLQRDRGLGHEIRPTLETPARDGRGDAQVVDRGGAQLQRRVAGPPRCAASPAAPGRVRRIRRARADPRRLNASCPLMGCTGDAVARQSAAFKGDVAALRSACTGTWAQSREPASQRLRLARPPGT